ncbi:PepSY domain-containing protein [Pseudanabaena sp. FACHB-2040]|uniref:PepSY-associated TM helix domain-containing protein n=1 Tax=Pseudanabaena sp. FACHB-2040 TaxID=2692859 RepID=UPI0016893BAA|nr:PepSY domain-containing protein [Pseudanabaena sp. FACHB-2040]MBD2258068.1 PepSY domain-containing protein [Pseudanabaena sp. FACHB-2040]
MAKSLSADVAVSSPANRLYQAVWRWHFYAGLWVIPFMLILAITGIIYLFKPQLDTVMYRNLMFVQPTPAAVTYTEQMKAVQRAYPEAAVTQVIPPVADNRSTEIQIATPDERNLMVFVNPYTGQILGARDEDHNLQAIARTLHGELMIGRWGDYLVELAACWALVLLISGLYLWLPRQRFSVWGTLIPRLWSQNRRIFWRDLHAVPGVYGTLLIAFLILTGLPWSGFWGESFANVWGRFPAQMWDEVPQSTVLTQQLNYLGEQVVPWAVEKLPMPQSVLLVHTHSGDLPAIAPTPISLDEIVTIAKANAAPSGYSISLPGGETGVYTVSASPNDPTQEVTLHIDQYSGQLLANVSWQDYGLVPKAVEMGIAIHMGKYFGLANQLLMLLACLILIGLSISGAILWWQRRPSGRLGAPPFPTDGNQWKVPLVIAAVLGIAFPLVGLSLVAVLLLDYLVIARIPTLQRLLN